MNCTENFNLKEYNWHIDIIISSIDNLFLIAVSDPMDYASTSFANTADRLAALYDEPFRGKESGRYRIPVTPLCILGMNAD